MKPLFLLTILILYCFTCVEVYAQNLNIVSISPQANANNVARNANISITFDLAIDAATLNNASIIVRSSQTGVVKGVLTGGGTTTITFNPDNNFRLGEVISFTVNTLLKSPTNLNLVRGHTYSFTVITGPPPAATVTLAQRHVAFDFIRPENTASIDFEGDGDLDFIVTGEVGLGSQYTYLYRNDGNQEFCKRDKPVGQNINVELYDIDGDGDLDCFSSGGNGVNLDWNRNEGDEGYFTKRPIIANNDISWTVRGNDLDSDGDVDLVAMMGNGNGTSNIKVYRNNGAGVFSSPLNLSTPSNGFETETYLHLADINTDGAMDILAYRYNSKNLVWYQNNGSQVFTEKIIINKPENQRLSTADVDGDGDIDILSVGNSSVLELAWYENDGNENFTTHAVTVTNIKGVRLDHIKATDVDGDLDMDLVSAAYWFENDGNENFTQHPINEGMKTGLITASYGDLDNDGDMDLITTGIGYNWHENVRFMKVTAISPANAGFSVAANTNIQITFDQVINPATLSTKSIVVTSKWRGVIPGTYSGGGTNTVTFNPTTDLLPGEDIEVAVTHRVRSLSGHALEINYGIDFKVKVSVAGTPTFSASQVIAHTSTPTGMDIADMDGDGDIDAVSCSSTELLLHLNDGTGNFTTTAIPITIVPKTVFATDFNKDGKMDIMVNASLTYIYLNDGSQNFTETLVSVQGGTLNMHGFGDVDRDGDTDIIYGGRWADRTCDFFNQGSTASTGTGNTEKIADLDGDGDIDFMKSTNISVVNLNDGYLNWTALNIDGLTVSTDLADFDGDGDFDIISSLNALAWYENKLNTASKNFGTRKTFGTSLNHSWVTAADFDGDGDADVAAVSQSAGRVVWHKNQLNEASNDFSAAQFIPNSGNPLIVKAADLNGDGTLDLMILFNANKLAWYANNGATCPVPQITSQPQSTSTCIGSDYTLSVTATGNQPLSYQWQKNNVNISGATSSSLILISLDQNDADNYQCVVTNTCGVTTSAKASVSVVAPPAPPTGIGSASCVDAAITLTASGGTNGQYRWYNASNVIIAGQTNSTYVTPVINTTTNYSVAITNGSCESTKTSVTATIQPLAKPILTASKPITNNAINICTGDDVILTAPAGFQTYVWSTGAGTQQITINTSGTYTVTLKDAGGCTSSPSDPVNININPYPLADITFSASSLSASPGDSYQWYQNNEPSTNGNAQTFDLSLLEYGVYKVDVSTKGCTTTSSDFVYLITGYETQQNGWKVFPNPFTNTLTVKPPSQQKAQIEIIDILGRSVKRFSINDIAELPVQDISQGTYFLIIKTDNKVLQVRITKAQ